MHNDMWLVLLCALAVTLAAVRLRLRSLFLLQGILAVAALVSGGYWFVTGEGLFPVCTPLGTILQRGSLEAIESVAGVVGIGNILFGWTYTGRDKLTLGKSQSDLIRYLFGPGYAASVMIHFSMTALCLLFAKVGDKQGALFAFLTLLWGCIPQALICAMIAMNQRRREATALSMWRKDDTSGALETKVTEMIGHLGESDACKHEGYWDALCEVMAKWLTSLSTESFLQPTSMVQDAEKIAIVSFKLRDIIEKTPTLQQNRYGEALLATICAKMEGSGEDGGLDVMDSKAALLSCAYFHFLFGTVTNPDDLVRDSGSVGETEGKTDHLSTRIAELGYYDTAYRGSNFTHVTSYLRSLLTGVEWYMFLTRRTGVPRHIVYQQPTPPTDDGNAFKALIRAIFGEDSRVRTRAASGEDSEARDEGHDYPSIAWGQVKGEVTDGASENAEVSKENVCSGVGGV